VWENTSKALYADYFSSEAHAMAFSGLNFLYTVAQLIFALLIKFGLEAHALSIILMVPSLLIVPGYLTVLAKRDRSLADGN